MILKGIIGAKMSYRIPEQERPYYGIYRNPDGTLPPFSGLESGRIAEFIRNFFVVPGDTYLELVLKDPTAMGIVRKAYEKGNPGTQNGFDKQAMPCRLAELMRVHCTQG